MLEYQPLGVIEGGWRDVNIVAGRKCEWIADIGDRSKGREATVRTGLWCEEIILSEIVAGVVEKCFVWHGGSRDEVYTQVGSGNQI